MKAIWRDLDQSEVTLTDVPFAESDPDEDFLYLFITPNMGDWTVAEAAFAFDASDARTFAEHLMMWATKKETR